MATALNVSFLGIEVALIASALLALARIGFVRLDSAIGIHRDGIPLGRTAPSWGLPDVSSRMRYTPAKDHWQFLIFTDHSLFGLPQLLMAISQFAAASHGVEILLMSRDSGALCEATARALAMAGARVPIVQVNQAFYDRFGVRVMPFAILLDADGVVLWQGLVNTEQQLFHMLEMGRATAHASDRAGSFDREHTDA